MWGGREREVLSKETALQMNFMTDDAITHKCRATFVPLTHFQLYLPVPSPPLSSTCVCHEAEERNRWRWDHSQVLVSAPPLHLPHVQNVAATLSAFIVL